MLKVKSDFPIFENNPSLVYLDSSATTQKPKFVLDAEREFYETSYANVHRGAYDLALRADMAYEKSRSKVANFIGAKEAAEVIFTSGTTQAINMLAAMMMGVIVCKEDIILVMADSHHSNLIPWQMVAKVMGAKIEIVKLTNEGELDEADYAAKLAGGNVKVVACSHVSNVLGTRFDIKKIARLAHDAGALIAVDGAQGIGHMPLDVAAMDLDFYSFSGHKVFAATGVGVLYGKRSLLERFSPAFGGGGMTQKTSYEVCNPAKIPARFEAGTPPITQAVSLAAALDYINNIGLEKIMEHEQKLTEKMREVFLGLPEVRVLGTAKEKNPIFSFTVKDKSVYDIATLLSEQQVCVRSGHHCAEPLLNMMGESGAVRVSAAIYNTEEDIEKFAKALKKVLEVLK